MLMAVKNNVRFFLGALKVSVLSAAEYKSSFIIQTLFMFINNGFFLVFWNVVFGVNDGAANGLEFNGILYLWSIPVISYGVTYFFFGGVQNLNTFIITGQMDSYMLQPKYPLLNVLTSKCTFSAFGDILYGVVIGFIATGHDIKKMLLVLFLGCFGSIFYISVEVIFRSLSVWLKDTEKISTKYVHSFMTTFSSYPNEIFSKGVKILLFTVVPASYFSHFPIKLLEEFKTSTFVLILVAGFVYLFIAILVFNKAMKSYESGNSISMRM